MDIFSVTGCCAVREIGFLSNGYKTAHESMKKFCRKIWENPYDYYPRDSSKVKPHAFYVFTGVVKGLRNKRYGPEFAAFIIENGLGELTESVAKSNRVNHPKHHVKVWVWSPDEDRLRAWWKENK